MSSPFRADLHCHSFFSDGTKSPEEIIDYALLVGLGGLSLTDHDTLLGYERALPYAEKKGLKLLSGVEFSTRFKKEGIHVLAYGFSLQNRDIMALCERHQRRRQMRAKAILAKLRALGIKVEDEELLTQVQGVVGRVHIALLLYKKRYVFSPKEAFLKYLGEGKPAYDDSDPISLEETMEIVHRARGKLVLAHPQYIRNQAVLEELLEMPFDGVEGYYGLFPKNEETRLLMTARKKGLLITGGSDYHGDARPDVHLGASTTNGETFSLLYDHFLGNQ